jgi:hypothetical protein
MPVQDAQRELRQMRGPHTEHTGDIAYLSQAIMTSERRAEALVFFVIF